MRPRHLFARNQLPTLLRLRPGAKAAELATDASTSLATMTRILNEAAGEVIRVGKAGRTVYFLRRALRGQAGEVPVYAVDHSGQVRSVGALCLTAPAGAVWDVAALGWPVADEFAQGVWPGLPYPLQDMCPQGFLGRSFARQHAAALAVPDNPRQWTDDDVLHVLSQRVFDTSGHLIVGDSALQQWLALKAQGQVPISASDLEQAYASLAEDAAAQGPAGSSAGGEFPKFTALRALEGSQTPHVIVKFSGAEPSGTVRRWADLLVCEHLALQVLGSLPGLQCAPSRILQSQGRTYLEVERFDRHGLFGRSPLCSLATLEAALLDRSSEDWAVLGAAMQAQGWLTAADTTRLRLIVAFGRLIKNTDMHKGNVSFVPADGLFRLAPVYDMLPMAYAPLAGGELPVVTYAPGLPMPQDSELWQLASAAAQSFWRAAASDVRISLAFRDICACNAEVLSRLHDLA